MASSYLPTGQLTVEAEEQTTERRQNGSFIPSGQTTMPDPHLPRETLDYIIDFLHIKPETLRECCLVSKSWILYTRKHLFAHIKFRSVVDLESEEDIPRSFELWACLSYPYPIGSLPRGGRLHRWRRRWLDPDIFSR